MYIHKFNNKKINIIILEFLVYNINIETKTLNIF